MRSSLRVALASLLLTAACGDDDAAGGDASPPDAGVDAPPSAPTLADICNASDGLLVDLYSTLFECFPEIGFVSGGVPVAGDLATICDGALQPYLDDGTIELGSAQAFADCRAYLDALTCDTLQDQRSSPCDELLVGTIAMNEACDSNDQCAGEAYCDQSGVAACGICRATKPTSTSCREDLECASRFCHPDTRQCDMRAGEDEACTARSDCAGTRVCSPTSNTCVDEPTWAVDSPCHDFLDCDLVTSGLYCDGAIARCRQFLALDTPCGESTAACDFIHYEHCAESPASSGTYRCTGPTLVGAGEVCDFFQGLKCQAGLACTDQDHNDQTPAVCLAPRDLGETCNGADLPCKLLLECVEGRCQFGSYTGECP